MKDPHAANSRASTTNRLTANKQFVRQIWIAPTFCAVLTAIKLLTPGGAGDPAYFCFLPMCFVFAASAQAATHQRLARLEQLADAPR